VTYSERCKFVLTCRAAILVLDTCLFDTNSIYLLNYGC